MIKQKGRERKLDYDEAVDIATLIFWQHGYEGTSISTLTKAMGVNPPSLYNRFGSKENLFFVAVNHYNATYGSFFDRTIEEEEDGLTMLQRLLHEAADHYLAPSLPGGCLIISAAINLTPTNKQIGQQLTEMRNNNLRRISSREGISESTARYIGAILQGMSQQARDGATLDELHQIADIAILAVKHN